MFSPAAEVSRTFFRPNPAQSMVIFLAGLLTRRFRCVPTPLSLADLGSQPLRQKVHPPGRTPTFVCVTTSAFPFTVTWSGACSVIPSAYITGVSMTRAMLFPCLFNVLITGALQRKTMLVQAGAVAPQEIFPSSVEDVTCATVATWLIPKPSAHGESNQQPVTSTDSDR